MMKCVKTSILAYAGWLTLALSLLQCDLDHGLQVKKELNNIPHGIKGTLTFNGAWPENMAEARLVAAANFPPEPSDPLDSFIFSDPIQIGVETLDYGLMLNPASYQIIAVIFREKATSWDIANILSVYSPLSSCTIIPDLSRAVEIESDTTVVEGVDISVDLTKGSIGGRVEITGEPPSGVKFAGIFAFKHPFNFNSLIPCGVALLPLDADSLNYKMLVPAGDYTVSALAGENISDFTRLRLIGNYTAPNNPSSPGVVRIGKNQNRSEISLKVDWSKY
ncbi:MAG: hypothetical protein ACE5HS_15850 [bacterium]